MLTLLSKHAFISVGLRLISLLMIQIGNALLNAQLINLQIIIQGVAFLNVYSSPQPSNM